MRRRTAAPTPSSRSTPTASPTTCSASASARATTSASTSRTAPSTSRRCWPASRSGPCRSTSTTATSPASCATCSTTATPSGVLHGPQHAERRRRGAARAADGAVDAGHRATTTTPPSPPPRPSGPPRGDAVGDDHYVIYTGGTTGMPKGVVWRQEDAFYACLGGGDPMRIAGRGDVARRAARADRRRRDHLPHRSRPLMHAAAQWTSFMWFFAGGKVVLMQGSLDPGRGVDDDRGARGVNAHHRRRRRGGQAAARRVGRATPGAGTCRSLYSISNGGAPDVAGLQGRASSTAFPTCMVNDGFGSSEAGIQGSSRVTAADAPGRRAPSASRPAAPKPLLVLDDDDRPVEPGSRRRRPHRHRRAPAARLPQRPGEDGGHLPRGRRRALAHHRRPRHGGRATARWTCSAAARRRSTPAARRCTPRRWRACSTPTRRWPTCSWSACPTSGGAAPSPRWCSRRPAPPPTLAELAAHCRAQLAGYKVPKHLVVVDRVVRSPAGKADYRWASEEAASAVAGGSVSSRDPG